jgi:hypothetical protein
MAKNSNQSINQSINQHLLEDWTHSQESRTTPSPDLEPTGQEEERQALQQLDVDH